MHSVVQLCLAANNIRLMRNETTLFSFLRSLCPKMADRFTSRRYSLKNKLGDRMIKRLLNLVIAKYRDCWCLADQLFALAFGFGK